jgi:hypothetical protein
MARWEAMVKLSVIEWGSVHCLQDACNGPLAVSVVHGHRGEAEPDVQRGLCTSRERSAAMME